MNNLLVILGPTASGKSDLAIKMAKLFNGEIISADSRQVYRGMDIGTGKVPISYESRSEESAKSSIPRSLFNNKRRRIFMYSSGIRHHLLDIADPKEYFSVAQYQKLALQAIKDIQKRGKLPILCGGTGLYLSVIIEGWQLPQVPPNPRLRQDLEEFSLEQLFEKLKASDPKRAQHIDPHNRRRLIRALEIVSQNKAISPLKKITPPWEILILGIKKDKNELKELIKKRLLKRLDEGMIEEVKKLKEKGVSSQRLEDFGLEYRWINRYLEKKITYEEMVDSLYHDICHYAKRQMTWFTRQIFAKQNLGGLKKIPNIHWVENENAAIKLTTQFLSN